MVNWRTLPRMRPENNENPLAQNAHYQRRPARPMRWFNPSLAHRTENPRLGERAAAHKSSKWCPYLDGGPLSKLHSFPFKMHYTRAINSGPVPISLQSSH